MLTLLFYLYRRVLPDVSSRDATTFLISPSEALCRSVQPSEQFRSFPSFSLSGPALGRPAGHSPCPPPGSRRIRIKPASIKTLLPTFRRVSRRRTASPSSPNTLVFHSIPLRRARIPHRLIRGRCR